MKVEIVKTGDAGCNKCGGAMKKSKAGKKTGGGLLYKKAQEGEKFTVDSSGYANPIKYPMSSSKVVDKKGNKVFTFKDSTGKVKFSGPDEITSGKDYKGRPAPIGASNSNRHTVDSTNYMATVKRETSKFNLNKAASNAMNKKPVAGRSVAGR